MPARPRATSEYSLHAIQQSIQYFAPRMFLFWGRCPMTPKRLALLVLPTLLAGCGSGGIAPTPIPSPEPTTPTPTPTPAPPTPTPAPSLDGVWVLSAALRPNQPYSGSVLAQFVVHKNQPRCTVFFSDDRPEIAFGTLIPFTEHDGVFRASFFADPIVSRIPQSDVAENDTWRVSVTGTRLPIADVGDFDVIFEVSVEEQFPISAIRLYSDGVLQRFRDSASEAALLANNCPGG